MRLHRIEGRVMIRLLLRTPSDQMTIRIVFCVAFPDSGTVRSSAESSFDGKRRWEEARKAEGEPFQNVLLGLNQLRNV
jgi:hypothetical protein